MRPFILGFQDAPFMAAPRPGQGTLKGTLKLTSSTGTFDKDSATD